MAVTAADFLIANGGRLEPDWYDPHDLETDLLPAWITQAGTATDELVTVRVYRRAFTTLVDLVMSDPAQQRDRDKSSAYLEAQLSWWIDQRDYYAREEAAMTGANAPVLTPWEGHHA